MHLCVAYDIGSNRLRLRVARLCKRIGLIRIQKSVFAGRAKPADIAELEDTFKPLLSQHDKLIILPLDKPTFRNLLTQSNDAKLQVLQGGFHVYDF